jgi:hypothetical protein
LLDLLNKLSNKKIDKTKKNGTKDELCLNIKNILLDLEKYSTSKDGNKKTYMMIPANHPKYDFPYNLEDRVKDRTIKIKQIIDREVDIKIKHLDKKYILTFYYNKDNEKLIKLGCKNENNNWTLILD